MWKMRQRTFIQKEEEEKRFKAKLRQLFVLKNQSQIRLVSGVRLETTDEYKIDKSNLLIKPIRTMIRIKQMKHQAKPNG